VAALVIVIPPVVDLRCDAKMSALVTRIDEHRLAPAAGRIDQRVPITSTSRGSRDS